MFLIIVGEIEFGRNWVKKYELELEEETLELMVLVGIGVEGKIGPFEAYAFLGIGIAFEYDGVTDETKYGGLVRLEAEVDIKIAEIMIRAELKGLVYDDGGTTKCDYTGLVKIEVEIFLIFSISANYEIEDTTTF